jgi:hypothetical protein
MPKMTQHIQHHHPQQPQYVHYTGPPGSQLTVAPQDTTRQPQATPQPPAQQQPQQQNAVAGPSTGAQSSPLVATGDWTKDLVHLAKTAELKYVSDSVIFAVAPMCQIGLDNISCDIFSNHYSSRKHALSLQLHTAHILSAHATLDSKSKAIQDIREQKNKYVSTMALFF